MQGPDDNTRRPVKARGLAIMHRAAGTLARARVTPNAVSVASVVFAAGAGALLALTASLDAGSIGERMAFLASACLIGLRLLANLIDGLIAVEGGKRTPLGGVFNEFPDRVSDVLVLIGAGYAAGGSPTLGFLAAIVAVLIAYVRELGHGLGAAHHFAGPMAKQQRMTTLIAVGVWLAATPTAWRTENQGAILGLPAIACVLIIALGLVTMFRRLRRIAHDLRALPTQSPAEDAP